MIPLVLYASSFFGGAFLTAKLCGFVDWAWWVIVSPYAILVVAFAVLYLLQNNE